ncbi:hypothetical protein F2Q69_00005967 [Brassica cretica]|uniref:Uncharacterized protein n=1 Tax=Brassica cretica TaxID=69181 RepID=A0A8S9P8F9_BRACR|nr:hypothetical protein F2Q69_00005967 [Brassica cretica]
MEKLRYTWPINLDKRYLALGQLRLPVKPEPEFSILFEDNRKTKVPWSGPLPTTSLAIRLNTVFIQAIIIKRPLLQSLKRLKNNPRFVIKAK